MELSYEVADARVRAIGGVPAKHLRSFVAWLGSQQYSAGYVCIVARHALAFGRWCQGRGIEFAALSDADIPRFQRSRARRRSRRSETRRQERQALTLLLRFLREHGICAVVAAPPTAVDCIAADFAQHLRRNQALASATVEGYTRLARQFLAWRFGQAAVCLHELRPTDAIAAYLQHGRPPCEDRHLFLRSLAPIRGLLEGSDGVGSIVRDALERAKVDAPHRGSHQFRHALAAHMLRQGASLSEIGQVLRHRSPQSTSIYAKVDLAALRTLAMAWPGDAR